MITAKEARYISEEVGIVKSDPYKKARRAVCYWDKTIRRAASKGKTAISFCYVDHVGMFFYPDLDMCEREILRNILKENGYVVNDYYNTISW